MDAYIFQADLLCGTREYCEMTYRIRTLGHRATWRRWRRTVVIALWRASGLPLGVLLAASALIDRDAARPLIGPHNSFIGR